MAQWSAAAEEQRKTEKVASIITERIDLFKRFRANGWEVNAAKPVPHTGVFTFALLPDKYPSSDVHFRVKTPGAAPTLVRSIGQLYRLAKGLE